MKRDQQGFTLIELIIFIIGTSILAGTLLLSYQLSLKNMPAMNNNFIAMQLADQCMEGFIGERRLLGYSSSTLACSDSPTLPSVCQAPSGYTVDATITCTPTLSGDTTTSRTVAVTVTGLGDATLNTILANY